MRISGSLATARLASLCLPLALLPRIIGAQASGTEAQAAQPRQLVGAFTPTQQRTGNLAPTGQQRVFGRIVIRKAEGDSTRSRVVLDITTEKSNVTLLWAVHPGQCGTSTLPLLALNVFPAIDIAGNGRGHVEGDLPLEFPVSGQFHANVYNEGPGQGLEDVLTCASLRFEKTKGK